MKIYTRTGDDGTTGLQGGKRVSKFNPRIKAYGAVDEINSSIGIILSDKIDGDIHKILEQIQNDKEFEDELQKVVKPLLYSHYLDLLLNLFEYEDLLNCYNNFKICPKFIW